MTTYILAGGAIGKDIQSEQLLHAEIVKNLGPAPKIVVCYWAQPRETWEGRFDYYQDKVIQLFPKNVTPQLSLAMPSTFEEQMKNADVVYITGGDDMLLQSYMREFDLQSLFKNKVVVGSSAGVNVLVDSFWTCDWRECKKGLGLLQIKVITHFLSEYGSEDKRGPIDWQKGKKELETFSTSLPMYMIKEGEFVVIEV